MSSLLKIETDYKKRTGQFLMDVCTEILVCLAGKRKVSDLAGPTAPKHETVKIEGLHGHL